MTHHTSKDARFCVCGHSHFYGHYFEGTSFVLLESVVATTMNSAVSPPPNFRTSTCWLIVVVLLVLPILGFSWVNEEWWILSDSLPDSSTKLKSPKTSGGSIRSNYPSRSTQSTPLFQTHLAWSLEYGVYEPEQTVENYYDERPSKDFRLKNASWTLEHGMVVECFRGGD